MNKAMRRMVAKVDGLTRRVASMREQVEQLERCITAMGVAAVEKHRGRGEGADAALVADIARHPPDRETVVSVARAVLRPIVALLPAEKRPAALAAEAPAESMFSFLRLHPTQCTPDEAKLIEMTAQAARTYCVTWADLGVGADGSLS